MFGVRSTDAGFLELARTYLSRFLVEDGPDEMLFSADCGVGRTLPGGKEIHGIGRLYRGGLTVFRGRDRGEMLAKLISSARDIATSHSNQFVRIRAGAVSIDGSTVLLPTMPEPHLPALVGLLVQAGAEYLGDEMVNLDPILRNVHSVALPLLIDTEDLPLFPAVAAGPDGRRRRASRRDQAFMRAVTPRRPVSLEELGGRNADPAPVGWIVFPEFRPGSPSEIHAAGGADVLFRFTQSCLNLNVWRDRALILMRELMETTPVARLVVGSIPEAAELLRRSVPGASGR